MDIEKLEKLPKWAQMEFQIMQNNLNYAKKSLAEMYGERKTNTSIFGLNKDKPLPNGATVDFDIGNNVISCTIFEEELRIYGRNTILVLPRTSNSIYIK